MNYEAKLMKISFKQIMRQLCVFVFLLLRVFVVRCFQKHTDTKSRSHKKRDCPFEAVSFFIQYTEE
jgi:hypothetical protein